jgi:hypothetical protein
MVFSQIFNISMVVLKGCHDNISVTTITIVTTDIFSKTIKLILAK